MARARPLIFLPAGAVLFSPLPIAAAVLRLGMRAPALGIGGKEVGARGLGIFGATAFAGEAARGARMYYRKADLVGLAELWV
jgi:hypothetical protein